MYMYLGFDWSILVNILKVENPTNNNVFPMKILMTEI